MGKVEWGRGRGDAVALAVGGIAVALGGAALFGMVAHTWTPFLPQRGAGLSPFDAVARADPPPPSTPLIPRRKRPSGIAFEPRPDELQQVEAAQVASVDVQSLPLAAQPSPHDDLPVLLDPAPAIVGVATAEAHSADSGDAESPVLAPRPVVIRVADVKVAGAHGAKAIAADVRLVESVPPGAKPPRIKPARRAAEKKAVEAKLGEAKRAAEKKAVEAKLGEAKRAAEKKAAESKLAQAKRAAEKKAIEAKLAEAKRAAGKKAAEAKYAEAKRAAERKAAEARLAEAKRAAEVKLAEDKRAAEVKLAEEKRAAELKAAEAKLAELKGAAELKALEAKLAESQRAFEMRAAEAKLAETRRAVETTLAEAKLAEAKLAEAKLAETRRAVDVTLSMARPVARPAADARPSVPRYGRCESCGTVTSVMRYRERGSYGWEVRVDFGGGAERAFDYSSEPGFAVGERVRYEAGRIVPLYPRRPTMYSPT